MGKTGGFAVRWWRESSHEDTCGAERARTRLRLEATDCVDRKSAALEGQKSSEPAQLRPEACEYTKSLSFIWELERAEQEDIESTCSYLRAKGGIDPTPRNYSYLIMLEGWGRVNKRRIPQANSKELQQDLTIYKTVFTNSLSFSFLLLFSTVLLYFLQISNPPIFPKLLLKPSV